MLQISDNNVIVKPDLETAAISCASFLQKDVHQIITSTVEVSIDIHRYPNEVWNHYGMATASYLVAKKMCTLANVHVFLQHGKKTLFKRSSRFHTDRLSPQPPAKFCWLFWETLGNKVTFYEHKVVIFPEKTFSEKNVFGKTVSIFHKNKIINS